LPRQWSSRQKNQERDEESPQPSLLRKLKQRAKKKRREKLKLPPKTRSANPSAEIAIEIRLPTSKLAETVYMSLLPETKQPSGFRSRVIVKLTGRTLELNIGADDIVALRAASNTFLRFVAVAAKTVNIVAPFYRESSAE
jgi:tRNA threonylcarbamoyladenosine modification (KEOPS) complex  Pcc1 subunit